MGVVKFDKSTQVSILEDYLSGMKSRELQDKYGCSAGYPAMLKSRYGTVQNLKDGIPAQAVPRQFRRKREVEKPRARIDVMDLARRFSAGEFDRAEFSRRMRGEVADA